MAHIITFYFSITSPSELRHVARLLNPLLCKPLLSVAHDDFSPVKPSFRAVGNMDI